MSKLRIMRIDSLNGETHFILQDSEEIDRPLQVGKVDEAEIRRVAKKEASKPLLLKRNE